jgi:hypothetical protein
MDDVRKAILSNCQSKWLKVARVIYMARQQLSLPDNDESYDLVAEQLTRLLEDRELEGIGDLSNWRHSEVRLPGP